jgi:hypothetical protein
MNLGALGAGRVSGPKWIMAKANESLKYGSTSSPNKEYLKLHSKIHNLYLRLNKGL